jgi:hypothetical protein
MAESDPFPPVADFSANDRSTLALAFLGDGFSESKVRLAHELGNLTNRNAVKGAQENLAANRNSIQAIAGASLREQPPKRLRVVSPYLFLAEYEGDDSGHLDYDDVSPAVRRVTVDHPQARFH